MVASLRIVLIAIGIAQAASKTALLVVDVQDCFLDAQGTNSKLDGTLAVVDTSSIVPIINNLRKSNLFDLIVRSQDFHPAKHISFGTTHGLDGFAHLMGKGELPLMCVNPSSGLEADASCCPTHHIAPYDCDSKLCPDTTKMNDELLQHVKSSPACTVCRDSPEECFETTQAMWPDHCLQQGDSVFPPALITDSGDIVVQKGGNQFVDSYSAFMDNTRKIRTPLEETLKSNGITEIYVVGIATDYCVYFSALDALELGFKVKVIEDATRGISPEGMRKAIEDMTDKGAEIVRSRNILEMSTSSASVAGLKWFAGLVSFVVAVAAI